MTATAQINPGMLTWARERSGIALADFANRAHIPFGYLFLNHPPVDELPIPDLRTVGDQGVPQPSAVLETEMVRYLDELGYETIR